MSQFFSLLFFVFFLKITIVSLAARIINKHYHDLLGSILGSWLIVQCSLIALMLFLSLFHSLTGSKIWLGLVLLSLLLMLINWKTDSPKMPTREYLIFTSLSNRVVLLVLFLIFLSLSYRSLYFYDNSWDALTYGLTRIQFYLQYHSLFDVQPTRAFHIFSNEWNGELNALFYSLTTANDQATSFANVEIWLLSFLGLSWLSSLFGVPRGLEFVVGALLSSTPLMLGLAMTVKGDLLAIVSFAIAFGFSLRFLSNRLDPSLNLVFAFAALGIANGAKIVVLPTVSLVTVTLVGFAILRKNKLWKSLVYASILFCLANSRYLINILIYGEPLKHVEKTAVALSNINCNFVGILKTSFSWPTFSSPTMLLNQGFGYLGLLLGLSLFIKFWKRKKNQPQKKPASFIFLMKNSPGHCLFLSAYLIGLGFLLIALPWFPWSLRYFAPYLILLAVFILALPFRGLSSSTLRRFADYCILPITCLIIIANSLGLFLPLGEGFPVSFEEARNQSSMERKLAAHPDFWAGGLGLKNMGFDNMPGGTVLIYHDLDYLLLPFWGEQSQNRLELVDNIKTFKSKLSTKNYAAAVISPSLLNHQMLKISGYRLSSSTDYWVLFLPEKKMT